MIKKLMKSSLVVSLLLIAAVPAHAAAVVFLHISGRPTAFDNLVREHFGRAYEVRLVDDQLRAYQAPRGVSGFERLGPVYSDGKCFNGHAMISYVVTENGSVIAPFVVSSPNETVSKAAVAGMAQRRFEPARIDEAPVAIIAVSDLVFDCPHESAK